MAQNKKKAKKSGPAKKTAKSKTKALKSKAVKAKSSPKVTTKPKKLSSKATPKAASKKITKSIPAVKAKTELAPKSSKTKISFRPTEDRLVVIVEGTSDRTPGGLYIPGNAESRPMQGKVMSAGQGKRNKKGQIRPLDVKVGDRVVFAQFAGVKAEISGEEVLLLREEEILGVLNS